MPVPGRDASRCKWSVDASRLEEEPVIHQIEKHPGKRRCRVEWRVVQTTDGSGRDLTGKTRKMGGPPNLVTTSVDLLWNPEPLPRESTFLGILGTGVMHREDASCGCKRRHTSKPLPSPGSAASILFLVMNPA